MIFRVLKVTLVICLSANPSQQATTRKKKRKASTIVEEVLGPQRPNLPSSQHMTVENLVAPLSRTVEFGSIVSCRLLRPRQAQRAREDPRLESRPAVGNLEHRSGLVEETPTATGG